MRVTAGKRYVFQPCLLDRCDGRTGLQPGDIVTVVRLHGCPPPNTMGHCHVNGPDGRFAGLVCTASLQPLRSL